MRLSGVQLILCVCVGVHISHDLPRRITRLCSRVECIIKKKKNRPHLKAGEEQLD